jgi:hypothetical protein
MKLQTFAANLVAAFRYVKNVGRWIGQKLRRLQVATLRSLWRERAAKVKEVVPMEAVLSILFLWVLLTVCAAVSPVDR